MDEANCGITEFEVWHPKWKWFQPPLWKLFHWAYRIENVWFHTLDCIPNTNKPRKCRSITVKEPRMHIKMHKYKININGQWCSPADITKNKEEDNVSVSK